MCHLRSWWKGALEYLQSIIHYNTKWDCFPRNTNSAECRCVYLPGFLAHNSHLKARFGQVLARMYAPRHPRPGISLTTDTAGWTLLRLCGTKTRTWTEASWNTVNMSGIICNYSWQSFITSGGDMMDVSKPLELLTNVLLQQWQSLGENLACLKCLPLFCLRS